MVPLTSFGSAGNQIGINDTGLIACQNTYPNPGNGCPTDPYGGCTQVTPLPRNSVHFQSLLHELTDWNQLIQRLGFRLHAALLRG